MPRIARAAHAALLSALSATSVTAATLSCHQPQLAADATAVYLTCGTDNSIRFTRSEDGGRSFAPLTTVATMGALALGGHRGPRVAVAGDTIVVTAIAGVLGGGKDGDLLAWRSTDRGKTWSDAVTVNDVPGSAREGLHAMAARGAMVVAAWLDLRAKGTKLYAATSTDAGRTWQRNVLVYESPSGHICECCHPSLAIAANGEVLVMFRNAVDGHRDLYLARGKDGIFGPAEKLGTATWLMDACPMDGGAVITNPDGGIATVWRREQTVYLAAPGRSEVRVGDGMNPALAPTPAGPVIAWNAAGGLTVAAPDRNPFVLDAAGRFVALAPVADGVLAAWETGDRVSTALVYSVRPN